MTAEGFEPPFFSLSYTSLVTGILSTWIYFWTKPFLLAMNENNTFHFNLSRCHRLRVSTVWGECLLQVKWRWLELKSFLPWVKNTLPICSTDLQEIKVFHICSEWSLMLRFWCYAISVHQAAEKLSWFLHMRNLQLMVTLQGFVLKWNWQFRLEF